MRAATVFDEKLVAEIDGKRYHVAEESQAKEAGGRVWDVKLVPDDETPPKPFTVPLASFHEGAGFSYAGIPNSYEIADGWDASVPGMARTWARHATGSAQTLTNDYGFLRAYNGSLYMLRGRYSKKYTPNTTAGATWTVSETKDFGAGNHVCGQPVPWNGNLYVPIANSSGVAQRWYECVGGSPDTWNQGPAGKEALGFGLYQELLARFFGNGVATCATTPTTAANWSDDGTTMYASGDPGFDVTWLAEWDRLLLVGKENGLFSFNENFKSVNELPDLAAGPASAENCRGAAYTNGVLLVPHISGLIRWRPQAYLSIGPEQEGGLEGDISDGYGMFRAIVPHGRMAFFTSYDAANAKAYIGAFYPSRGGRGPLVPHIHFEVTSGYFEDACLVTSGTHTYLAVIKTSSDGLTAEPWIYEVPRAGLSASTDPRVAHATSSASLKTSRVFMPERGLKKTFREVRLWAELSPESNIPGLQVWASVDGGSWFQLNDGGGSAKTAETTGFHQFFFPHTSAAVGHYVQLDFRVPALAGGEVAVAVTIRDASLRGSYQPLHVQAISTTLILTKGEFEDKTSQRYEPQQQIANLQAVAKPHAAPVPFRDPWGNDGWCQVQSLEWKEIQFKGKEASTLVANVVLREEAYA